MKKILLILAALVGGFLFLGFCGLLLTVDVDDEPGADIPASQAAVKALEAEPEPEPEPEPTEWTQIKAWSGSGSKETETFQTQSREWRINWQLKGSGLLTITVYDESGGRVSLVANTTDPGSDTSYVRSSPGGHYLDITGLQSPWQISVEDQR